MDVSHSQQAENRRGGRTWNSQGPQLADNPRIRLYRYGLGTPTSPSRYHSTVLLVRIDGQAIAVSTMENGLRIFFPPKIEFPALRAFPPWNHGSTSAFPCDVT